MTYFELFALGFVPVLAFCGAAALWEIIWEAVEKR